MTNEKACMARKKEHRKGGDMTSVDYLSIMP
jgi:hypothetical protein